jgi:hypothetical protein
MMTGIRRRFVILCLVSMSGACGGAHLGPGVGRRYHQAFAGQVERTGSPMAGRDSADAHRTLARHHKGETHVGEGAASISTAPAADPAGVTLGIGADRNPNPIRLEAK